MPRTPSHDGNTVTNPHDIANIFNTYFASVAKTVKQNIKCLHKQFSYYLKYPCTNSFFIQPTDCAEIASISSLKINKVSSLHSVPNKVLNLIKTGISKQFVDLFNLSFSSGVFLSLVKIAKVVSVYKNGF